MPNTNNGCLPFTGRRLGAILLVIAAIWNLVTLVAADKAPAPIMNFPPALRSTDTPIVASSFSIAIVSDTPTPLLGPEGIPTRTQTATASSTATPAVTPCTIWNHWPAHVVQWGDSLNTLAHATGSTTEDLRRANCLSGDPITPGQLLYLPRPAFRTALPTPGGLLVSTPTAAVVDLPTVFQARSAIIPLCYYPYSLYLDVQASDPQGVSSITAFYSVNGGPLVEVPVALGGAAFHGQRAMPDWSPGAGTVYTYFRLIDGLGNDSYSSVDTAVLVGFNSR